MESLRDVLRRNLGLKLVALGGAVAIWTFVVTRPTLERAVEAELRYANVPHELELNPDQVDQVTVILSGDRGRLDELAGRAQSAEVDLSHVSGPGERTFTITEESLALPQGVHLVRAIPSQLRLHLESRIRRDLPVQPTFVGVAANGYSLDSYTVDPPLLTVVGPESRVSLLGQVTTDRIDLSQVIGEKTFHAAAYMSDPYVRFEDNAQVTVNVQMKSRQ
jgi:YbbR domain-containing protein